ncbi:mitochondrial inner membrane translocase subunit Tim17/Tim22/Tim23/peroxisomal protein PMP24, partial [Suillus subluteus]
GLSIGAFFSLMSSSFAYGDSLLPQSTRTSMNKQKAGKSFGEVGALFARIECLYFIVSLDLISHLLVNPVTAGFVAGGVLARNLRPKAALGGGLAFVAFSAAIDLFLQRE